MVAALSTLADQAASKFDQQRTTATSLVAAMKDSITAMREAAALAEQLKAKYVEQSLLMDSATGALIDDWNCSRTRDWGVTFAVSRCVCGEGGGLSGGMQASAALLAILFPAIRLLLRAQVQHASLAAASTVAAAAAG
jgi:hypothetical protein